MRCLRFTKPSEIKPMSWKPKSGKQSGRFTKQFLMFLLIVLLMLALSGCSKAVSIAPMQPLPANLASDCPPLPSPPKTLVDPDRAIWELEIVAKYGDCALRHKLTVDAWKKSSRPN